MHEMKLARQVFRRLTEIAAAHKLDRIRKVFLRVHCLESENGEVLSAALKELAAGTTLEGMVVEILSENAGHVQKAHSHDHDHEDHDDVGPGVGEVMIERIEA
jgi:Zn finger protein HypA/HybF involved in hydrogenase expression